MLFIYSLCKAFFIIFLFALSTNGHCVYLPTFFFKYTESGICQQFENLLLSANTKFAQCGNNY